MDKRILDVLQSQHLCTISTVNQEDKSESALIGFAEMPNLSLIFGTASTSRKYHNLRQNTSVALVFNLINGQQKLSIQYEGTAEQLTGDELVKLKEIFFAKNPQAKSYDLDPHQVFFKVTPIWIRYSDYSVNPHEIFELAAFSD